MRRHHEDGFTLIELMVVVLIIAILMAIAIPTYLSVRNSANNRAAQSDLRNALTVEQTLYAHGQTYVGAGSVSGQSELQASEPNLAWVSTGTPSMAKTNEVQALSAAASSACLASSSVSGNWYAIWVDAAAGPTLYYTAVGASSTDPCTNLGGSVPTAGTAGWSATPW